MRRKQAIWMALAGVTAYAVARRFGWNGRGWSSTRRQNAFGTDERVTEELEQSFPASDPPSHTPTSASITY